MSKHIINRTTLYVSAGFAGLTLISACTNSRLDDGDYRSIGQQQAPKQFQNHAANEASSALGDAYKEGAPEMPESEIPLPDFPGSIQIDTPKSSQKADDEQHLVRFGHNTTINKIVKTARIHCQPSSYKVNTQKNSFWGDGMGVLTQCSYRFPQHCGGHSFSVLNYGKKEVLIYQPQDSTHYIIDTLIGTPVSQPGLWDKDDHLGSNTSNAAYFFQQDYNNAYQPASNTPASLGWIIKASHKDEEAFGRKYHRAIQDITACF